VHGKALKQIFVVIKTLKTSHSYCISLQMTSRGMPSITFKLSWIK